MSRSVDPKKRTSPLGKAAASLRALRASHEERHRPTGFGFAFADRVDYLRLLHSTIDHAIEWRCQRLSLGRTALEPKAALGAQPESMTVWLRHRVPAVNWMLRGLLGAVPHDEVPQRNPFKAGSGIGPTRDCQS